MAGWTDGCAWTVGLRPEFQTSFRPMYNQGSNFQHIIEKRRKQGKGIEEEGQRKNQETKGKLEVLLEGATFKKPWKT